MMRICCLTRIYLVFLGHQFNPCDGRICGLKCVKGVWPDWFLNVMSKKIGCGGSTLFWHSVWCGYTTFRQAFPILFTLSKQQGCFVVKMGKWVEGVGFEGQMEATFLCVEKGEI